MQNAFVSVGNYTRQLSGHRQTYLCGSALYKALGCVDRHATFAQPRLQSWGRPCRTLSSNHCSLVRQRQAAEVALGNIMVIAKEEDEPLVMY